MSKLWRYDWCKNTCWCVVVGSNKGVCATRWWNHIGCSDEYLRCIVSKFLWACSSQGFAPVMGRISSTSLHWSLFCSCWNSSPDTEVRWCPKKLWLLLLCVKLHMKFERTRLLKDGKRRFETEWHATSAESCSCRNLKMRPDQKTTAAIYDSKHTWFFLTYMNDVYSCSFKKYYTPIWFTSYPTALLYVLQFHATLLTKNLLNQKSASTPWTHFSKIRGVLLWRGVTIEMNLLKFMKVLFLNMMKLCKPVCAARILKCWIERYELVRTTARVLWHEDIALDELSVT